MSYVILGRRDGYDLIWSAGMDPDGHRYIGRYRTRYEAQFDKALLERGFDEQEIKTQASARERAQYRGPYKRRRSRFDRVRRDEDVL